MDEGRGGGGGASKYKYKRKRKRNKGFGIAELCVHHGNLRGVPKKVLPSVGNIYIINVWVVFISLVVSRTLCA